MRNSRLNDNKATGADDLLPEFLFATADELFNAAFKWKTVFTECD